MKSHASYITSALQNIFTPVTFAELTTENDMVAEVLKLNPWVTFKKPPFPE